MNYYERRKSKEPSRTGQARQNLSYKIISFGVVSDDRFKEHESLFRGRITKLKKCTLSPENPTHSNNLMMIGGRRDKT